jgi:hypothetical protein
MRVEFLCGRSHSCIEETMRFPQFGLIVFAATLILFALPSVAISGSFRGKIVEGAQSAADPNWIYVQGRNGMIRRVEISHAQVDYDAGVEASGRRRKPQDALTAGAEVRVTAEQGSDGEWRATRIEVLKPAADSPQDSPTPPKTTN